MTPTQMTTFKTIKKANLSNVYSWLKAASNLPERAEAKKLYIGAAKAELAKLDQSHFVLEDREVEKENRRGYVLAPNYKEVDLFGGGFWVPDAKEPSNQYWLNRTLKPSEIIDLGFDPINDEIRAKY